MNYIRTKTVASSSLIQTLLSVPEFHRIGHITWFADYTAGREFRPAPKNLSEYQYTICLLYTSDAADEEDSVEIGGSRIIKKKKKITEKKKKTR